MLNIPHFLALCFFMNVKGGIPKSTQLLNRSLIAHFLLGLTLFALMIDPVEASIQISAKLFLMSFFIFATVLLTKKFDLLIPAFTAIVMCENLIAIVGIPVVIWINMAEQDVYIPFYLSVALVIWGLAVTGFILRQLLSFKAGLATIVALLYFLVTDLGAFLVLL